MKPYLVDVPVSLNVFIRPGTLEQVFEAVKKARPRTLFLVGDGPRENVPSDIENIRKSREIVEEIDWDCEVHKLYTSENRGMYTTGLSAKKYIFKHVDRCIFLEDDVLVSTSFFRFCEELLEKYKDDLRVGYISGMNYLEKYEEPNSDYFFSREASTWGYATWKRTMSRHTHEYRNDDYVINRTKLLASIDRKEFKKKIQGYVENDVYEGHLAGSEYYKRFLEYADNQLIIVPTKNMICNLGFTSGSTHAPDNLKKMPRGLQKIFNMKTYEYDFPLVHPNYMVRDIYYENKMRRIFAYRRPLVQVYRKVEILFRYIYYGEYKRIVNWIKRTLKRDKNRYEN